MGKQQTHSRPAIHAPRVFESYFICKGAGCKNAIGVWVKTELCSRCQVGELSRP